MDAMNWPAPAKTIPLLLLLTFLSCAALLYHAQRFRGAGRQAGLLEKLRHAQYTVDRIELDFRNIVGDNPLAKSRIEIGKGIGRRCRPVKPRDNFLREQDLDIAGVAALCNRTLEG